ncbi:carbon-nitrogen hydrolase [Mycena albidolilacea]|uniref:Carbon-nitrogen hydrolase n=1 Tax=Mycena albidolilacea TaxID=1033008 RepID=A0AAD6ZHC3_9AGAR|nr:carbon-nitrogen hydrolase [Mycena albidolilacea]
MKVAAIQAEPAWWDLKAGVAKTILLVKEAASNGAELVGFPESFIPGYPLAIWARPFNSSFLLKFQKNCLSVQSEEFKEILAATKEAGIWVVLRFCEIDGRSMYASQAIINSEGVPVLHRRKIKATGNERTIWGDGPADSFQTAVKGPGGATIGALSCWEHLQPLLRFHHYSLGVQVHVASWPYCDSIANGAPSNFSSEAGTVQCKFAALEGQMFVISSTQLLRRENAELCGVKGTGMWEMPMGGGFAAIYAPDGTQITPTVPPDEEIILYADIDLDATRMAKLVGDPVGHCSRPDLLSLNVNARVNSLVSYDEQRDYTLLSRIT